MLIVIMGVSGCGKSTIGQILADEIGGTYFDGDDFHPPENVEKMRSGTPLTDDDRSGWMARLNALLSSRATSESHTVLACSALRQIHRQRLSANLSPPPVFVFLKGTFETIQARIEARIGHYMPATLLRSQFETLEEPTGAVAVSIDADPQEIVSEICSQLSL